MVEGAEDRPVDTWVLSRRQLLGSGLLGAAGLALSGHLPVGPSGTARTSSTSGAAATAGPEVAGAATAGQPGQPAALRVDGLAAPSDWGGGTSSSPGRCGTPDVGRARVPTGSSSPDQRRDLAPPPRRGIPARSARPSRPSCRTGVPRCRPTPRYRWTVQTWDASGTRAGPPSSRPSRPDWTTATGAPRGSVGRPASSPSPASTPTPAVSSTSAAEGSARARAYVSGDQQYELYLNGVRAGKGQAYCYPDSHVLRDPRCHRPRSAPARPTPSGIVSSWQGPTKGHPAGKPRA